jgi:hypothetical protein
MSLDGHHCVLLARCAPESAEWEHYILQPVHKPFDLCCHSRSRHSHSLVTMLWAVVAMFSLVAIVAAAAAAVIVDGLVVLEMNWNRKKQGDRGSSRSRGGAHHVEAIGLPYCEYWGQRWNRRRRMGGGRWWGHYDVAAKDRVGIQT